ANIKKYKIERDINLKAIIFILIYFLQWQKKWTIIYVMLSKTPYLKGNYLKHLIIHYLETQTY
ncbi:MAG: hypothetical protein WAQ83_06435, partial [Saprospiraceae bacterium]